MSIRIEFDPHALNQMRDRGITEGQVRWLLANGKPCSTFTPPKRETRYGRCGLIGSKEAKTVFLQNPVRVYVITVMWVYERE